MNSKTALSSKPQRHVRRFFRWALPIVSVCFVGLLLFWFGGAFHRKVSPPPSNESVSSLTGQPLIMVRQVTRPRYESATGTIKPVYEANVASKILARVIEVNVTAGKQVKEGEVLVRLSDEEQQTKVRQAESERESRKAEFELAKIEFSRATQLLRNQAISRAEYDLANTRLQTGEANWNRAERAVEETKVFLNYATIRAPFDGTIVDKAVQPGDTVAPGQKLLTIYDPSHMQLVASVRESLALKLKVGQKLPAELESLDLKCLATVSEIVPQADSASRSFEVKVTGPCPDGVYSGMFARLMLPLEEEQLLLIPRDAVQRVGQLTYVNVAADGRIVRRSIQIGREFDAEVEILSGLCAGEPIVLMAPSKERNNE